MSNCDLSKETDFTVILMEPFFPVVANCCMCEQEVVLRTFGPNYGIPMYEGIPVPVDWEDEWGGATACKECFDKYEAGQLQMWPGKRLPYHEQ